VYREDFPVMLFPGLDWEFIETNVEELDGAIAGCDEALIFVGFGPGEIEEGILGVKP